MMFVETWVIPCVYFRHCEQISSQLSKALAASPDIDLESAFNCIFIHNRVQDAFLVEHFTTNVEVKIFRNLGRDHSTAENVGVFFHNGSITVKTDLDGYRLCRNCLV